MAWCSSGRSISSNGVTSCPWSSMIWICGVLYPLEEIGPEPAPPEYEEGAQATVDDLIEVNLGTEEEAYLHQCYIITWGKRALYSVPQRKPGCLCLELQGNARLGPLCTVCLLEIEQSQQASEQKSLLLSSFGKGDTDSDRAKDRGKAKKAKDLVLGTELKANSSHRHGNRAESKMSSNRCWQQAFHRSNTHAWEVSPVFLLPRYGKWLQTSSSWNISHLPCFSQSSISDYVMIGQPRNVFHS